MGSSERIDSLDGLRGIAILSVVFVHWLVGPSKQELKALSPELYEILNQANHGVDVFFVISGFLIGRILLTQSGQQDFLKAFYIRRFFRIIPLYYTVICFFFLLRVGISSYPSYVIPAESYFFFINNVLAVSGWHNTSEFGPYWSLAVEEQFYLTSAVIAAFFGRKGVVALAALFVIGSIGVRIILFLDWIEFGWWKSTLGHTDPIGIGLLAAALVTNSRAAEWLKDNVVLLRAAGIGALVPFLAACQFRPGIALGLDTVSVSVAVACWILLKSVSRSDSVLAAAPLRAIGKMCFSLYILHAGWGVYAGAVLDFTGILGAARMALSFALLLLVCRVLWIYVESPLIAAGHKWQYGTRNPGTAG